ncbi:MAG: hypothetical protein QM627_09715 [Luteolibacter sp.]
MKTPLLWRKHLRHNRGFALIVTLTLMVLLTIIALGLLSLSTINLRQSSKELALSNAKANARMALMLAIGELQAAAGPDTRVTARADILDANNPPILGVWKSWEGTDHESNGRPLAPDYGSKRQSAESGGRFVRWLVSGDPEKLNDINQLPRTDRANNRVEIIGDNTVGRGSDLRKYKVNLEPVQIQNSNGRGAYAWWVDGENQKAHIPRPEEERSQSAASWASKMNSHSVSDPKPFGLDALLDDPVAVSKTVTLRQTDLLSAQSSNPPSQQYFFDLSTISKGLLTNTATGGWRKDLSLFTEKYDSLPSSNLQLFRLNPDEDDSRSRASVNQPLAAGSLLYPWASYGSRGARPYDQAGAVASWANLTDYVLMYRKFGNSQSFSLPRSPMTMQGNVGTYLHAVKPMPIVARVQWLISYNYNAGSNVLELLMNPVVTLWNPYNVTLDVGRMVFSLASNTSFPLSVQYDVNSGSGIITSNGYWFISVGVINKSGIRTLGGGVSPEFYVEQVGQIPPGGVRVFTAATRALSSNSIRADSGFVPSNGHRFQMWGYHPGESDNRQIRPNSSYTTISTSIKTETPIPEGSLQGETGIKLVVREDGGGGQGASSRKDGSDSNEMVYQMLLPAATASSKEIGLPAVDVQQLIASGTSYPLASFVFGLRLLENLNEPGEVHTIGKGFVQGTPLAGFSDMNLSQNVQDRVNAAYDYNVIVHTGNSDVVPNANGSNGYLLTGLTAATGLARCIAAELPVQPLSSLAQLQGWDMRFGNPVPPFSYNVIGNSDASPLIPPASVVPSGVNSNNLQHDDSYCANHLLFDDWFFSSINQGNPNQFGQGGSLKDNFSNFITGQSPLANAAYKPVAEDQAISQRGGSDLYERYVEPNDSWRKVASRIEVQGMFNVNSTSVAAWRALLGHARGQQVPYYAGNSNVTLASQTDHAVSRFGVAGDPQADNESQGGGDDGRSNATQYTGYRVLSDQVIDALAKEIVNQVRQRGPFLSLSEFVNRQLSSNKDLALAGTIQTALNAMQRDIHGGVDAQNANADPKTSGYEFPEAAEGSSAYGMPGWIRQADVLRPIAPILSARDDTFTIRTYGDARDASGKILATAYCEAVVARTRNYCDPAEPADLADPPQSATNKLFGRKFEMISFRWLSKSEI